MTFEASGPRADRDARKLNDAVLKLLTERAAISQESTERDRNIGTEVQPRTEMSQSPSPPPSTYASTAKNKAGREKPQKTKPLHEGRFEYMGGHPDVPKRGGRKVQVFPTELRVLDPQGTIRVAIPGEYIKRVRHEQATSGGFGEFETAPDHYVIIEIEAAGRTYDVKLKALGMTKGKDAASLYSAVNSVRAAAPVVSSTTQSTTQGIGDTPSHAENEDSSMHPNVDTHVVLATIEKLADLHRAGVLTDEEFADKKRELLARL